MSSSDDRRPLPVPGDAEAPDESGTPLAEALTGRPVAEHVAVLEAEHARLQRQLATIDQL